ncbi:hypothetical protein ACFFQW_40050 [Umezawaea endophytica]|uniref:Uncharacterized protein n=1 Tax=Umezawaea endophytica TaxID=1654476 RepID=A0A9X2ZZ67_9PSEU|nr:hypothetical protein [Umezawaea endophytica]MCS7475588.1 hypothetical protein [Umezawaea endophytica]
MSDVHPPFLQDNVVDELPPTSTGDPVPRVVRGRSSGRTAVVVVGALLLVLGSALSGAGSLGRWADASLRDADGFLGTGSKPFHTSGYALSFGAVDMRWTKAGLPVGQDWLGVVELEVDQDVFVGIGAADDVADYLSGVDHDVVRPNGSEFRYRHQDGGPVPSEPAARPIWVAYGIGSLAWQAEEGKWTVVVLNHDGSRTVDTALSARATVPALGPVATTALHGGALVLLLGAVTLAVTAPPPSRRAPE